MKKETKLTN